MPTDEELAYQVQQGDVDALHWLVERHHSPLLGFLYRMTGGDRALAEDMAQETFVRMMRGIGGYAYPRPFKPWLYAIAVNRTRDYFRKAEQRRTVSADTGFLRRQVGGTAVQPESQVTLRDEVDRMATAVAELPPHQRETIVLRYAEGLRLAEIADVLDIPVGTVKSRLSLGIRRLREMMDDG